MEWTDALLEQMQAGRVYSHKDLVSECLSARPGVSKGSLQWALDLLEKKGELQHLGYDSYALPMGIPKAFYEPDYSDLSYALIHFLAKEFPKVRFTVFETVLLNEFLNHLIAQNTIFLQVEKPSSTFIFRFLQDKSPTSILYNPSKKEFDLYWSKDCVVITDLVSEAPLSKGKSRSIMLEKILVDLLADKLVASTFSKAEYGDILEQAQNKYLLDETRMLRYASRRNRKGELMKYLVRKG